MHTVLALRGIQLDVELLFFRVYVKFLSERLILFRDDLQLHGSLWHGWKMCDPIQVRAHLPMNRLAFAELRNLM